MDESCVFCNFKEDSVKVYDDKLCYAIVSRNPINKYHILIIPKKHYENFTDLPDKLAGHIFLKAKVLSLAVKKTCKPDAITHLSDDDVSKSGYNLSSHYKFHIIPRFKADMNLIDWSKLRLSLDLKDRVQIAKAVKAKLY